jgi:hypothetical protein
MRLLEGVSFYILAIMGKFEFYFIESVGDALSFSYLTALM